MDLLAGIVFPCESFSYVTTSRQFVNNPWQEQQLFTDLVELKVKIMESIKLTLFETVRKGRTEDLKGY